MYAECGRQFQCWLHNNVIGFIEKNCREPPDSLSTLIFTPLLHLQRRIIDKIEAVIHDMHHNSRPDRAGLAEQVCYQNADHECV